MRRWVKVLVVLVLMTCASLATCFVFYKNLKNDSNIDYTIADYLKSGERTLFNQELMEVKSNCDDDRIELLITTLENHEKILRENNYYLVNFSSKIDNKKEIKTQFNNLLNARQNLYSMMIEYNLKCEKSNPAHPFNKFLGTNDMYDSFANYFIEFSKFNQATNNKIIEAISSGNTDIKYSMIDLYSNVVIEAFKNVITDNTLRTISNENNINLMNNLILFNNGQIQTNTSYFSISTSSFIINYNICNKEIFAKNLYKNVTTIGSLNDNMSNIEIASYYFKEIFVI